MFTNDLKKALEEAKGDADQKSIRLSEMNKQLIVVDKMIKEAKIKELTKALKQKDESSLKENIALEEALVAEREAHTKDVEYHEEIIAELFYEF
uniref:Uncharacterized protein n=1 Tax=Cannabis sativa TaxID=3483 RepID=A0A803QCY9_CANSA